MRRLGWPKISRAQVRMLRAWFGDNYLKWDAHVQAHATLLSNPLARAFAHFVVKVFRPPQPIHIGKTAEEAEAFLGRCCSAPRSFVKSKQEYRDAPGWKGFLGG